MPDREMAKAIRDAIEELNVLISRANQQSIEVELEDVESTYTGSSVIHRTYIACIKKVL